jgi:hypothetical protein
MKKYRSRPGLGLCVAFSLAYWLTCSVEADTVNSKAQITFEVLATFDYPGNPQATYGFGINDAGVVVGQVVSEDLLRSGFVRYSDGRFSRRINEVNDHLIDTQFTGISNTGIISGWYQKNDIANLGFLLADGIYTEYIIPPGAENIYIWSVNDAGNFCGFGNDISTGSTAFISLDGVITFISVPGSSFTTATGINNQNQCVGYYHGEDNTDSGFFRDSDGTFTYPIMPRGNSQTNLFGINERRWMVGLDSDAAGFHGIFFSSPRTYSTFDYPGASETVFQSVNNHGVICGYYLDDQIHGLLVRVKVGGAN